MPQHRYLRKAALLAGASVTGLTVLGGAPAGAVTDCLSVSFPTTRLIDWDGYNPKVEWSPAVPASLPAGSYDLTGTSHDGYPSRGGVTQTSEIWELQFLDAGGNVIATSGLSADLPDRVVDANWSGSLGSVTLAGPAVSVRAHHRPDAIADGSANSVEPTAATVCPNGVDESTTVAPTTAPPTTAGPTSTAAPTTAVPTTATPTSGSPTTVPVKSETTASPVSVLAQTTIAAAPAPTPTVGEREELAVTGGSSRPAGGVALILLGAGVLLLGYRAQSITRRD
jgi:hypothetical protein